MDYYTFYSSLSKNKRITGCWDVTKTFEYSNGIDANSGMAIKGWCFDENGRFSKKNTFGFNGGIENSPYGKAHNLPVLRHTSYSDLSKLGWYQINGNIIQLIYDDGKKETKFIGVDDMFLLGTEVYFKMKKQQI
ncbi:MAG: hypothetical protein L3J53_03645 [Proteobacteria bacterium]|nr:hypothetical protein [Pseudomonadota bacterium]